MKANTDKIERVLAGYKNAAAKRGAEKKRKADLEKANKRARAVFEENARKKITDVVRPKMQQMLTRLDKKLFRFSIEKLADSGEMRENYEVETLKENHIGVTLSLSVTEYDNLVLVTYTYSLGEWHEEVATKLVDLKEIDQKLIERLFLFCLQKICE